MAADGEDGRTAADFVTYGTPLEPLDEDEAPRKPLPLHEQTVRDEKGRYQRFHGAFTGGFSAGYFNTVGSKEGWTPSTFVSSRQQKAEKHQATPQDFMDDEDMGEHGIAPAHITTTQPFAAPATRRDKAKTVNAQTTLIPGDNILEELVAPARSCIGVDLLTRMGWKAGQGVGPRVKRKTRRQRTPDGGARVFGCAPPPAGSEGSEEDDDEFAPENVTFAPKDVIAVDFSVRAGLQGLGYSGLDPMLALRGEAGDGHVDLFSPHSDATSRLFGETPRGSRRGGVAGQAFGVGALEDDDDEDVYQRDTMSKYDTVLGDEPGDGLYGWTAPHNKKKNTHHKEASYLGKILEGFTLAQNSEEKKTIFPPPSLPANFRPVHHFRPPVAVSHVSGVSAALAEALRSSRGHMVREDAAPAGRRHMASGQRGALLGEDALPGPASVMELLRPEDRQRLLRLRASAPAPAPAPAPSAGAASGRAARPSCPPTAPPSASSSAVSDEQQEAAAAAWRGGSHSQAFKPFEKNAGKQARYEAYLGRLRLGDKGAMEESLDPSMTEWERSREKEEFVRASILYRPSSSMLASRFTRATRQDDDDRAVEVEPEREDNLQDKKAAVKMKMFGKLTRETFEWHPDKIVCKRFNVPHPYPGSSTVGLPKVKRDKFSVFNFLTLTQGAEHPAPPKKAQATKKSRWDQEAQQNDAAAQQTSDINESSGVSSKTSEVTPEGRAESTPDGSCDLSQNREQEEEEEEEKEEEEEEEEEEDEQEVEEEVRPPMDVFKAIFASSSDDSKSSSSSSDEDCKEEEEGVDAQPTNLFDISSSSSAPTASGTTSSQQTAPVSCALSESQEVLEFGPKLPPLWFGPATGGAAAAALPARDRKHKNKKQHKRRKDRKKKKSKKNKNKVKHQEDKKKKTKKKEEEDASEQSDDDEDGKKDLIRRLKSVSSSHAPR
ncbi:G patch domain-containing protein 1 isoform X1 [Phycodurus eques]|uniref:G patch domain-containing protein 1 isoform X1 n=1 Tax=Phycodurus eques TaxID=693459 RepID=UPI002ACE2159|nr:G patch domain-containing protein 1 isoform X1 [Phycodurus eques]